MKLDRRKILTGSAMLATGTAAFSLFGMPFEIQPQASRIPGIASAEAASDVAAKEIAKSPEIGDIVMGNKDASVTMIEYASATCPHCANFHTGPFKEIKKAYIDTGKMKFIFREFPFDDLAMAAFMLGRCAPKEKYYPMLDIIFERQKIWVRNNPRDELFKIAKLAGFTEKTFDECLRNEKIAKGIYNIQKEHGKKFGIDSTPAFFINGKFLSGNQPFSKFKEVIEAQIGK